MIYTPLFDSIRDRAFMGDLSDIDRLTSDDVVSLLEEAILVKAAVYRQLRGLHDSVDALDAKTLFKNLTTSNRVQHYIRETRDVA